MSFGGFGANTGGGFGAFGKPAAPATGGFGGFGAPAQQPAAGGFGGFGAPAQQPAAGGFGGFGAPAQQPAAGGFGGFGAPAQQPAAGGFGGFGAPAQQPAAGGFGGFGAPAQQPAAGGFGGFGAPAQQPAAGGFGGFGAPAQQPAAGGFGGFGAQPQQQQQQNAFGAFGQPQQQQQQTGFGQQGGFGQQQPQGGFGQQNQQQNQQQQQQIQLPPHSDGRQRKSTVNYQFNAVIIPEGNKKTKFHNIQFDQNYRGSTWAELHYHDWMYRKMQQNGQQQQQQQQQQQPQVQGGFGTTAPPAASTGFGGFGAPAATTGFGFGAPAANTGFGGFGAPATAPAANTGFGGFGAPAAAPVANTGFGFGAPAAPAANTGFGFGATTTPAAPATGGFGFGAPAAPTAPATGFGFGAPAAPAAPATGFGGFGFGAPAAPVAAAPGGFGFGQQPAAATAPVAQTAPVTVQVPIPQRPAQEIILPSGPFIDCRGQIIGEDGKTLLTTLNPFTGGRQPVITPPVAVAPAVPAPATGGFGFGAPAATTAPPATTPATPATAAVTKPSTTPSKTMNTPRKTFQLNAQGKLLPSTTRHLTIPAIKTTTTGLTSSTPTRFHNSSTLLSTPGFSTKARLATGLNTTTTTPYNPRLNTTISSRGANPTLNITAMVSHTGAGLNATLNSTIAVNRSTTNTAGGVTNSITPQKLRSPYDLSHTHNTSALFSPHPSGKQYIHTPMPKVMTSLNHGLPPPQHGWDYSDSEDEYDPNYTLFDNNNNNLDSIDQSNDNIDKGQLYERSGRSGDDRFKNSDRSFVQQPSPTSFSHTPSTDSNGFEETIDIDDDGEDNYTQQRRSQLQQNQQQRNQQQQQQNHQQYDEDDNDNDNIDGQQYDDENDNEGNEQEIDQAMYPTNCNPDLIISPSIDEMHQFTEEQLSKLDGLRIDHPKYGYIQWLAPVDVRYIDFGISVTFDETGFEIYPQFPDNDDDDDDNMGEDYDTAPGPGEGINGPAQIAIFNCFPSKPLSNLNDDNTLIPQQITICSNGNSYLTSRLDQFELTLRSSLKETGGEFISYDRTAGIWSFVVGSF